LKVLLTGPWKMMMMAIGGLPITDK